MKMSASLRYVFDVRETDRQQFNENYYEILANEIVESRRTIRFSPYVRWISAYILYEAYIASAIFKNIERNSSQIITRSKRLAYFFAAICFFISSFRFSFIRSTEMFF